MQISEGRVVSVAASHIRVEIDTPPVCARCASGKGCGAGLLSGDRPRPKIDVELPTDFDLKPGDRVELSLAPTNVLRAAAVVYGLPLGGAVAGAATAWSLGFGDIGAALAALSGLTAGFFVARQRVRRQHCLRDITPAISRLIQGARSC